MKYQSIIVLGAPGSGKGTQGKALKALPEFFHCACGDVFRSINPDTKLGRIFLDYSKKGQLVPDDVTIRLWLDCISGCQRSHAFRPDEQYLVLDGIPRNITQAKLLEPFLEVLAVFHLHSPSDDELAERIKRRALKENRPDDATEAVIFRRLEIYKMESQPLLAHYPSSLLHTIDARQPVSAIHDQIISICNRFSKAGRLPFSPTSNKMSYESQPK
jgi:adenylate kinase